MTTTTYRSATDKQLYWIDRTLATKQIDADVATEIRRQLDAGLNTKQAGAWLDLLFAAPDKPVAGAVTEPGLYIHSGEVSKVQSNKAGTNLYAKKLVISESGRSPFVYEGGAIRNLTASEKLTPEQARQFGLTTGVCANCGERLEDPISIAIGLGTTCGPRIMGKEAYSAAKKTAKADPETASAITAREDRRKAAQAQSDWDRRRALPEDHPEAVHEDYRHFATQEEADKATTADLLAHFGIR